MGRTSLFSAPGSVLIKTTLVKSLHGRGIVGHPDRVLIKTSTDNSRWQTDRCSDDRNSRSLYTSGKAYSDLVLQATLASDFLGKCASTEEIGFLEVLGISSNGSQI